MAIPGAVDATVAIESATPADSGLYQVVVTGPAGSVTSATASVTVPAPSDKGRLVNISVRSPDGTGNATLIVGFFIAGPQGANLPVLILGAGPLLEQFDIKNFLADPTMTLFDGQTPIQTNDDWDSSDSVWFEPVGAFPFEPESKDAVIVLELPPGGYTAVVSGVGSTTGVALVEVYELP